jgi:hypothetical protein
MRRGETQRQRQEQKKREKEKQNGGISLVLPIHCSIYQGDMDV